MSVQTTPGQAGVDWQVAENAIAAWFAGATGIDVLWANQDIPQPPWPYGTLNMIAGPTKIGGEDNVRRSTDLNQAGEEVQLEHNGPRHITVSCQVIQGPPDTHNPDCHARRLAGAAHAALSLESINAAFNAAGLAVVNAEPVTNADIEVGGEWTSRGVFDVTFAFTSSITERVGYFENADIEGTFDDAGSDIVEDFSTNN
jgi:hypothetical protein